MSDFAIVHADLRPFGLWKDIWILTHWGGVHLGDVLADIIEVELLSVENEPQIPGLQLVLEIVGDLGGNNINSVLQRAVWKAAAHFHINNAALTREGFPDCVFNYHLYTVKKHGDKIAIEYQYVRADFDEKNIYEWLGSTKSDPVLLYVIDPQTKIVEVLGGLK